MINESNSNSIGFTPIKPNHQHKTSIPNASPYLGFRGDYQSNEVRETARQ